MNKIWTFFAVTAPAKLKALWAKLPPKTQQWLKGAEAAVVAAVVAAFVAAPASNFTTKKGIVEFIAGVGSTAYAALRLYMSQSPVTTVLVENTTVTSTVGDVSHSVSKTVTLQDPTAAEQTKGNPLPNTSQGESK